MRQATFKGYVMNAPLSPAIVVSACLAGIPCRYDGRANTCDPVVELVRQGRAVPLCPEGLAALPVPRLPCEILGAKVLRRDGADLTEAFALGAQRALELTLHHGCTHAIVKSRSPSCGVGSVYDGTFSKTLCAGDGLWVRLLRQHGISPITEEDLLELLNAHSLQELCSCWQASLTREGI